VRGEIMHVDLLRVDLKVAIQASVPVELVGQDEAPGIIDGGILEHVTREISIEALPTEIPESIVVDVSKMEMNATIQLSEVEAPKGITFLDDPETTVLASMTPPSVEPTTDEPEVETAVVGEGGAAAAAEGEAGGEAPAEGEAPADGGGEGGE
jgi:large subunit ribosomal protein L25